MRNKLFVLLIVYNRREIEKNQHEEEHIMDDKDKSMIKYTMNRPMVGAMCGVAVVALSILGLAHVFPEPLAALATIIFGISLFFKGATISLEYSKLMSHLAGSKLDKFELGGGVSAEMMTGLAGIVLAILALLNLYPVALIAVAMITFGAGFYYGQWSGLKIKCSKIRGFGYLK